jgi:hypothetical protein
VWTSLCIILRDGHTGQSFRKNNGVCVATKTTVAAPSSPTMTRDSGGLNKRPISTCHGKKVTSSTRMTLPVDINGFHQAEFLPGQGRTKLSRVRFVNLVGIPRLFV